MQIITNNQWRQFLYGDELPKKVLKNYEDMCNKDLSCDSFIKYRNNYYYLGDFLNIPENAKDFNGWHGYNSDSYFSGTLIKLSPCGYSYKIATYIN